MFLALILTLNTMGSEGKEGGKSPGKTPLFTKVDWSGQFPVFENGLVPLEPTLKLPGGCGASRRTQGEGFRGYFPA